MSSRRPTCAYCSLVDLTIQDSSVRRARGNWEKTVGFHGADGQDGDRGMMSPWTPQFRVLGHEAISFTLFHGGSNTAMECMVRGVPMSK